MHYPLRTNLNLRQRQLPASRHHVAAPRIPREHRYAPVQQNLMKGSHPLSGVGSANGSAPGFHGIKFTFTRPNPLIIFATRRASSGESFTPPSSTYSNVTYSRDPRGNFLQASSKHAQRIFLVDRHQRIALLVAGRIQRNRQLGPHRFRRQPLDSRHDPARRKRRMSRRDAHSRR